MSARPREGRRAPRAEAGILALLQQALAARPELSSTVSVTGCACLGPCFDGPSMVVYPEGTWYAGVRVEDVGELVASHLCGGKAVERLRYQWPDE